MKGVIFDFNGTLFLDNDKHVLAWNRISRQLREETSQRRSCTKK